MINFLIQIIIAVFIGWSYVYLAKKFKKNKIIYFCIGFFICLIFRIGYLFFYGVITDYKVDQDLNHHKNLSIVLSIIVAYVLFRLLRSALQDNNSETPNINEIGKE